MTTPPVLLASGYWDTQTGAPDSAPGAGKYRADNWTVPALVAIAALDSDGYDRHAGLIAILAGDTLFELAANDSQNYQAWTVATVTDQGSWVQFAVSVADQGSTFTPPGANQSRLLQALQVAPPPGEPPAAPPWVAWAPPLDPPTSGGLPYGQASAIADQCWMSSPHLCAALQWEAYAATLPPTPAVSAVSTGAQSVAYSPAAPTGSYGLAIQRAEWHRSFLTGGLVSVPLVKAPPTYVPALPWSSWWTVDQEPAP